MKRKAISMLLCAAMVIGTLVGCGSDNKPASSDAGTTAPAQTEAASSSTDAPAGGSGSLVYWSM